MNALAVRGAARLGKTGEMVADVAPQTFGEFLPGGLGDLDRRLGGAAAASSLRVRPRRYSRPAPLGAASRFRRPFR